MAGALRRRCVDHRAHDDDQRRPRVLRQALTLTGSGIAAGLVAAFTLSRVMQSLLYQVRPHDPATFALVPVALVVVALAASAIPAFRATRVSPLVALRSD